MSILEEAFRVLDIEIESLSLLKESIGENFKEFVTQCFNVSQKKGKIILSGIGKSGIVIQKTVSTLNSLGINSVFLHPVEAMHGDVGIINQEDICIMVSYSGESIELLTFMEYLNDLDLCTWAITGNKKSSLAHLAKYACFLVIKEEACPFSLAPTSSTLATLALGDCLALCLMKLKKISYEEYAKFHPAGAIGRTLTTSIKDLMRTGDNMAIVYQDSSVEDAVLAMCRSQGGTAILVDEKGEFLAVFTTGDLKRGFAKDRNFMQQKIRDVANHNAKTLCVDENLFSLKRVFQKYKINALPILATDRRVLGLVDTQDLVKLKLL